MAGEYIEFDNNNQPAVNDTNLNRLQQLIKQDIVGTIGGDTLPIGTIVQYGSDTIPTNWLLCDGSEVSRTEYQSLFNVIGISFGQGDGFSTFNLPNLTNNNLNYIIKAAQSATITSTIIDNLNSTSSTDALSANQGNVLKELLDGTVLYENPAGKTGHVTFSQDITNMKRLRISGYQTQGSIKYNFSQDVDVIFDGKSSLLFKGHIGASYNYIVSESFDLSSTTLTRGTQQRIGFSSSGTNIESTSIYITKVVGYNY